MAITLETLKSETSKIQTAYDVFTGQLLGKTPKINVPLTSATSVSSSLDKLASILDFMKTKNIPHLTEVEAAPDQTYHITKWWGDPKYQSSTTTSHDKADYLRINYEKMENIIEKAKVQIANVKKLVPAIVKHLPLAFIGAVLLSASIWCGGFLSKKNA